MIGDFLAYQICYYHITNKQGDDLIQFFEDHIKGFSKRILDNEHVFIS